MYVLYCHPSTCSHLFTPRPHSTVLRHLDCWGRGGTGLISKVSPSFHTAAPHKTFLATDQTVLPATLWASFLLSPCPHHCPTHCHLWQWRNLLISQRGSCSPSNFAYTCNRYNNEGRAHAHSWSVIFFYFCGVTARGLKRPRSRSWDPSSFPPSKTGPGRPLTQLGRPRTRTAATAALSQPRKDREEFRKALVGLVM